MKLYSKNAETFTAILKGRAAAASCFFEAVKTSKATATVIPPIEALSWAVNCCRWVAVAGVAFMSGCGSSATKTVTVQQAISQTTATTQTAVHIYAPYSAEGKLTVPVTKTVAGECFTSSIISQRSDAWRCNDGNELQDPCFAAVLNAHSVVCPQNGPWSGQALRIKLAKGLPSDGANILRNDHADNDPQTDPAWAIELTSGARCLFLAGTSSIVAGLRQSYECTGGLSLFGNEARSSEPWTIFGRHGSMGQLTQETVASIWF
ncbi:MAG: hypothetical protein WBV77_12430 [Solirubrobacteraceae bacterium]